MLSTSRACALSPVQLYVTPWTVACQAPLPMRFFKQEYWSRLPIPFPGDLPDPGIESQSHVSPALAGGFFTTEPPGSPSTSHLVRNLAPYKWETIL